MLAMKLIPLTVLEDVLVLAVECETYLRVQRKFIEIHQTNLKIQLIKQVL